MDQQLDVASLHLRHRAFQTRAAWDGVTPPVWSARPWTGDRTAWWDGTGAAATAGTAGDLDELLSKLDAEASGAGPGSGAASRLMALSGL